MTDNWNMLGHEWAVDMLRQHVRRGELRHAYLFSGAPGLGRRTLALRLAQALSCTQPLAVGIPCGACRDCKQIDAALHPDLSVIQPTIPDHDKRGEFLPYEYGEIRIEQIRNLQKTLNLRPYQSKYRMLIFTRFQQANIPSSNALLKTLEEAPAHAILMLTADSPEQLLPTIVSRCEILRLRPLSLDAIEADLLARGVDSDRARLLAHLSGGRPGYARRLLEDETLLNQRKERLNDLQTLLPASLVQKFAYAEKLSKDKDAMRQTLLIWLTYWRDVMLRAAQADAPLTNVDLSMEIEFLAGRIDLPAAQRLARSVEAALDRMERNINARLLLENLLMDFPKA
ncbi:MAG: DNA polymerase III subunit delta' [Anaerolineales bacterium]